jgi:hypothetical protein
MERFLKPTAILDYTDAGMRKLVEKHGWLDLDNTGKILHSWVEVYVEEQDRWINMEGFILDLPYLSKLQRKFADCTGSFCGYGVAVADFRNPPVKWDGNDTYIQKEGIVRDFGVFDGPDELFASQRQELGPVKSRLFRYLIRHLMNRNVRRIRNG